MKLNKILPSTFGLTINIEREVVLCCNANTQAREEIVEIFEKET